MDSIQMNLLEQVAGLHEIPAGAYNLRINGKSEGRNSSANIDIVAKEDKSGIDIIVKPGTKKESVHIPVLLSQTGLHDLVYNDFFIGDDCDITIVAGCGIHNDGSKTTSHEGIHTFHLGKNARLKYVEKHYGKGDGMGDNVMNPTTICNLGENSYMEMETVQIRGIDSTKRITKAVLEEGATLIIKEALMTHGKQYAETDFTIDMNGENSSAHVVSRSVAKEKSSQLFISRVNGNNKCAAHTECDAIIMDEASVRAVPEITANHLDASLIHEAAIGKIAGEQIIKLMTLGLTDRKSVV